MRTPSQSTSTSRFDFVHTLAMTSMFRGLVIAILIYKLLPDASEASESTIITVTIDRGQDVGQSFGSLFETTSGNGEVVVGAGFQNAYNTRYRADRHAVQFYVRPTSGVRELTTEELPRPSNDLTGSYLFGRDGVVYSTFGGLKTWDSQSNSWQDAEGAGGTHETMRVGNATLTFGDSSVTYNGRRILDPPEKGSYQLFFYANGHLCFYHVNRNDKPYRPYVNDEDGFSRLYACPWTPEQPHVDLSNATTLRLPVVGETTFAWGQLGRQLVTGSNIGGFYVFDNQEWRMLLAPNLGVSYQLYSSLAYHDRLLMGQYPTGRVFVYDGKAISDQKGWPPVLDGVSNHAREAQTSVIYGGDLLVGVWPWGEVWRHNPDSHKWLFTQRMFDHPDISDQITHPYEVENQGNSPQNKWGQRVTSLITNGPNLFISTSAKAPYKWEPKTYPFLAPQKWKSYGKVYRATMPGHLAAPTQWTDGPTTFKFVINGDELSIEQDGKRSATTTLTGSLAKKLSESGSVKTPEWGNGIYGRFGGPSINGSVSTQ